MKVIRTTLLAYLSQPHPQLFIRRWAVKEWLAQSAEVKTRTADE